MKVAEVRLSVVIFPVVFPG